MNGVLETGAQQIDDLVIEMVSDLICPWCFVAKRRVEKAAAILKKKVEVHWLPFELNADMPVDGLDRRVYRSAKFGLAAFGVESRTATHELWAGSRQVARALNEQRSGRTIQRLRLPNQARSTDKLLAAHTSPAAQLAKTGQCTHRVIQMDLCLW